VRLLFSFVGGRGHLEPLLPIAQAARAAGHTVGFGCAPAMVPAVEAAGLPATPIGRDTPPPKGRQPLLPLDPAREAAHLRDRFAARAARHRMPLVASLATSSGADVIVCDETDFGAMLAAERLGLPHATVLVIAAGGFVRAEVVAGALDAIRAEHGMPPDPRLEMPGRHLAVSTFPASFRDPEEVRGPTLRTFRSPLAPRASARTGAAPGPRVRAGARVAYLTLGTVFHLESGDLFERSLAGLAALPIEVVATVGDGLDPASLGPVPAHVHVTSYVAQHVLLPHCDVVVSHGGSGSVIGALAHGLPVVVMPIGADQPLNAARCAALGVGEVLDAAAATPDDIARAVSHVLEDPAPRRRAERLRDEIAALPDPAEVVPLLEALARYGKVAG
jgi:UDP:flavonoid glycosyltransferase YjiC (YdhE family)